MELHTSNNISKKILPLLLILGLILTSCSKDKKNNQIPFESFTVVEKNFSHFTQFGSIRKAIKPETTDDSLIGNIDKVIYAKNGDFLVGDYDSTKRILRFDSEGKFVRSYGKVGRGPGEYVSLAGFELTENGNIIVLSPFHLIKYSEDGRLLEQVRIKFAAGDIKIIGDKLYIYSWRHRSSSHEKTSIIVFNTNLKRIGGIGDYDSRMEKYLYVTHYPIDSYNGNLCFISNYDFKVNLYNPKLDRLQEILIPSENSRLDNIWAKKRLVEDDYTEIKKYLHRFGDLYGIGNRLLLQEDCKEKKIWKYWLMEPEARKISIIKPGGLFGYSEEESLHLQGIVGSYNGGIIVVFDDEKSFNKYKKDFKLLKDFDLKMDDNPILALFEFNQQI